MLIRSTRVHLHNESASSAQEIVGLMDRFLDRKPRYDLEWDDFISWENENTQAEQVRERIGKFEPLLFSSSLRDKLKYRNFIVEERNRLALLLGVPARERLTKLQSFNGFDTQEKDDIDHEDTESCRLQDDL